MNCKPGDLAVVVRARTHPDLLGRITRCLSLAGPSVWHVEPMRSRYISGYDCGGVIQFDVALANDDCLRPLRDEPGLDETLRLYDVPESPLGVEHVE